MSEEEKTLAKSLLARSEHTSAHRLHPLLYPPPYQKMGEENQESLRAALQMKGKQVAAMNPLAVGADVAGVFILYERMVRSIYAPASLVTYKRHPQRRPPCHTSP